MPGAPVAGSSLAKLNEQIATAPKIGPGTLAPPPTPAPAEPSKGTISAVVNKTTNDNSPSTVKVPAKTKVIPNPLNNYASYTYSWSLWWLSLEDYNRLMTEEDVDSAMAWEPKRSSYVVAEDGGRFPDRRIPGVPFNYNIQSVNFTTTVAPSEQSRSSNMIEGDMTIVEPYVTFLDTLALAAAEYSNANGGANIYTTFPYMLQLDFFGYDDKNNPIPTDGTLRKRFPINLISVAMEVSGHGAVYKIGFTPNGHMGHNPEKAGLPENVTINAGTVKQFFYNLEVALNGFWKRDTFIKNNAGWADSIHFDIDENIGKTSIVYGKSIPLSKANAGSKDIDTSKANFNIPKGTSILAIIDRVLSQSQFLIDQLKDAGTSDPKIQDNIFNAYKTTVSTKYVGVDQSGTETPGAYDQKRNTIPVSITYKIGQHPTWKGESPHLPQLSPSANFTTKDYNYLFTGKNTDVLDFKLNFDMTYYSSVLGYTSSIPESKITEDSKVDNKNYFGRNLSANFAALLNNIPNITPLKRRFLTSDKSLTQGGGVENNSEAQKAADAVKSIYTKSGGDMVQLDLKIIGDPTLIKQDDWLYIPSPNSTKAPKYTRWDSNSQFDFVDTYGHLRMDAGEIVVNVTVNSPIDIDTDITNQGLVYPQMGVNNQYKSLFSGQYHIIMIANTFANGKFEQTLTLARYVNDALLPEFTQQDNSTRAGEKSAIEKSQDNQATSSPATNDVATPAGDSNSNNAGQSTSDISYDESR